MQSLTFYARGDSSSANNAELNVRNLNQQPIVSLQFLTPAGGDLRLDFNNGLPDPDTLVLVNGVQQSFTINFFGTIPNQNKLANVAGQDLRGEDVVVITTQGGLRLFFLPSVTNPTVMAAIPNGSLRVGNVNTTTNYVLCFAEGTAIATPAGDVPVQALRAGDLVLTVDGRAVPILWRAETHVCDVALARFPTLQPVVIPAHAFGPGRPYADLMVSPQHRILFSGWACELHFGMPAVLARAVHLVPTIAHRAAPRGGVRYFHILCEDHEMLLSNGIASESFQPGELALAASGAHESLAHALAQAGREDLLRRDETLATLSRHEVALLFEARPGATAA